MVKEVYFEGGEPFLFYIVLLKGLRMARAAGLSAGIITNAFLGDVSHETRLRRGKT